MGGYCYFNNAAIATSNLSSQGKVAVLDIDFHHGNGTQEAFYDRNDVLYSSIHVNPKQRYPYTSGFIEEIGVGKGRGYNHNYPLPEGTSDKEYLETLDLVIPKIKEFKPDYLVVSLGFDTFIDDPIGGFKLTKNVYSEIAQRIKTIQLPTLIIQEGGYNIEHLGSLAANFLSVFK